MITTLKKIRAHGPCREGWQLLLHYLDKTQADDEPLSLKTILDANGLNDALWCLRTIEGRNREIRLYAVWCARQVQHLMPDPRSIAALDVVERYARGKASAEELSAARIGAWEAARVTAQEAAKEAAWAAAATARAAWEASEAAAVASAARIRAREAAAVASSKARWATWEVGTEDTADTVRDAQHAEFRRICCEIEAGRDPYPEEDGR